MGYRGGRKRRVVWKMGMWVLGEFRVDVYWFFVLCKCLVGRFCLIYIKIF